MDISHIERKLQDLHTELSKRREDISDAAKRLAAANQGDAGTVQNEQEAIKRLNEEALRLEEEARRLADELQVKQQQDLTLANRENDLVKQLDELTRQQAAVQQELDDVRGQRTGLVGTSSTSFF